MINSQDIKKGTCIRMDGKLYFCIDFLHRKPGKGNTIMNVTLKDVVNGYVLERRFNIGEKLEDVRVERRPYTYLYKEGDMHVFMHGETFEQIYIEESIINAPQWLKEGQYAEITVHADTETPLICELPAIIETVITYTEPGFAGNTATNATKPATVETGAEIKVPLFIGPGDRIRIDTRTGEYLSRA